MGSSDRYKWHTAFHDHAKNMYRTNYHDFMNIDPVALQADFPAGYGGNKPSIRHEVIHRNTSFEKTYGHLRDAKYASEGRYHFPEFTGNKQGIPVLTPNPQLPNAQFEYCTAIGGRLSPQDQIATFKKGPWGVNVPILPKLTFESEVTRPSKH
jgi:hypothetical protein